MFFFSLTSIYAWLETFEGFDACSLQSSVLFNYLGMWLKHISNLNGYADHMLVTNTTDIAATSGTAFCELNDLV